MAVLYYKTVKERTVNFVWLTSTPGQCRCVDLLTSRGHRFTSGSRHHADFHNSPLC